MQGFQSRFTRATTYVHKTITRAADSDFYVNCDLSVYIQLITLVLKI